LDKLLIFNREKMALNSVGWLDLSLRDYNWWNKDGTLAGIDRFPDVISELSEDENTCAQLVIEDGKTIVRNIDCNTVSDGDQYCRVYECAAPTSPEICFHFSDMGTSGDSSSTDCSGEGMELVYFKTEQEFKRYAWLGLPSPAWTSLTAEDGQGVFKNPDDSFTHFDLWGTYPWPLGEPKADSSKQFAHISPTAANGTKGFIMTNDIPSAIVCRKDYCSTIELNQNCQSSANYTVGNQCFPCPSGASCTDTGDLTLLPCGSNPDAPRPTVIPLKLTSIPLNEPNAWTYNSIINFAHNFEEDITNSLVDESRDSLHDDKIYAVRSQIEIPLGKDGFFRKSYLAPEHTVIASPRGIRWSLNWPFNNDRQLQLFPASFRIRFQIYTDGNVIIQIFEMNQFFFSDSYLSKKTWRRSMETLSFVLHRR
jgi:hypothetical protein